jgi:hypothetical protein
MRVSTLLFLFALMLAFQFAPASADTIPTGCHAITPDEQAALKEAGAVIPSNGQFCDSDKTLLFGACPESPYAYLETKKTGSNVDVAHLNADYACRLSKFLKAADAAGKNIRITSAYRSVALQADLYKSYLAKGGAPVAPPGRSRHNFGIAADLTFDGVWPNYGAGNNNTALCLQRLPSCKWAHDNSTTFGLKWPMLVEPWHVEPGTDVKGLAQLPTDPAYWSSDAGTTYAGTPLMSYPTLPQPSVVNSIAPVGTPTASPVTTPTQTPAATQPQICSPQFSCTGNVTYYHTSSCATQVYQVCQYGCASSGTACATSATSTSATSTQTNLTGTSTSIGTSTDITNSNDNTNTDSTGPSVSDILNSIANSVSFTATDVGTSTSLAFTLNPETGEVVQLGAPQNSTSTVAPGTITSIQPVAGQQTFVSTDIGNTVTGQYVPQQASSGFQTILNNLQSALIWALNVLKQL